MADNLNYNEPGAGPEVATDDVGGIHYQRFKLDGGADGVSEPITGTILFGLLVDVSRIQTALPAGNSVIGQVAITSGSVFIQGEIAHDAVDSGNPVKIGGIAASGEPTQVAISDRVNAWFDQFGRLVVAKNHPNPESPARTALTNTASTTGIVSPGPGLSIYITDMCGSNQGNSATTVDIKEGSTIKYSFMMASKGGGFVTNLQSPWKLPANTAFVLQQDQTVNTFITVNYFIAP